MLNFTNSQNITKWEDIPGKWRTPISNLIEEFNLPSYCYPELYEYFTSEVNGLVNGKVEYDVNDPYVFLNDIPGFNETITQIKYPDKMEELFFQVKNKGL